MNKYRVILAAWMWYSISFAADCKHPNQCVLITISQPSMSQDELNRALKDAVTKDDVSTVETLLKRNADPYYVCTSASKCYTNHVVIQSLLEQALLQN